MISKHLLVMCYECEISTSIHDTYEDVKDELESHGFDAGSISEIMCGYTFNDWDDHGYVKVTRIDL